MPNSALKDKNSLLENGYGLYYLTIHTDFPDRIEGLKESIQLRPEIYPEGVSILYVISSTDDRGVAILIKKNEKNRCAFHYFDYWGENEFWTLTDAGWEQK